MKNNQFASLPDLHVFTVVVDTGGFTAAAAKLGLNKPAITRAIQRLEHEVGIRLLNRTTRRVGMTDEGRALYERCKPALIDACRALSDARESRTEAKGLLRVTSPVSFGRKFIAPLTIAFRKAYAAIDIDLSLNDDLLDLVSSGVDIAVRGGVLQDSRLISKPLAPMPMYVCASPAFLSQHGIPQMPEELRRSRCIAFRFRASGKDMDWEFTRNGEDFCVPVDGALQVDDIEVARDAALAGEGIAQLPGYMAVQHIREGTLQPLLLPFVSTGRSFTLTYVNRREVQPLRDRLFVEFISEALRHTEPFTLSDQEMAYFVSATR